MYIPLKYQFLWNSFVELIDLVNNFPSIFKNISHLKYVLYSIIIRESSEDIPDSLLKKSKKDIWGFCTLMHLIKNLLE